jgi:hypothetical protein
MSVKKGNQNKTLQGMIQLSQYQLCDVKLVSTSKDSLASL